MSLRVERDTLAVQNGFTHYPQEREAFRFFKSDLKLPRKIIMLDGSGSLSFDVLSWLAAQNVMLVRIGWRGDVVSVIGGSGSPYDTERLLWQLHTRNDPIKRLEFCSNLIGEKLRSSLISLHTALPPSDLRNTAVAKAEAAIQGLELGSARNVTDVLLAEARAAAAYFATWRTIPLQWRSMKRFPTPESWKTPTTRRSDHSRSRSLNRNATHPVNAMLNYAYAALHSQVQLELVAQGYDPSRGIMHESRLDAQALVLDLMEVRRPIVDAAVLKFIAANRFSGADFVIRDDGVCRLAPQLAKRIVEATHAACADQPPSLSSISGDRSEAVPVVLRLLQAG